MPPAMGVGAARFGGSDPWAFATTEAIVQGMTTSHAIDRHAAEMLAAARAFQSETEQSGSYVAAPDALASLENAFQALSAAWYQLAADAVPRAVHSSGRRDAAQGAADGLSREAEVRLVGTLHDVAAGFARCARTCRESRRRAAPIIARAAATRREESHKSNDLSASAGNAPPAIGAVA
jgi:hypothetical protein